MDQMLGWLTGQIEMVGVDKKIRGRVKQQMEKSQQSTRADEGDSKQITRMDRAK